MNKLENRGPLLSDADFFEQGLDLALPALSAVRTAVERRDFKAARRAFGAFLREQPVPSAFFDIPYEPPENMVTFDGETEAQACERIMQHTLISVGVPCAYGAGQTVDWEANPTHNGYLEWPFQLNRHHELKMLAHQYRATGNEALAACAAELLDSWLAQALFPGDVLGYKTLCWRTIECGIRTGCTWPYTFYAFCRAEAFSDDLLTDWMKSFVEHGHRLSRNHMSGNWLVMEMNGLAHISMMFPFLSMAKSWRAQSFQSLEEELGRQVYPDGFQYELTTNYHNVIIINYQRLIETCTALGYEVPDGIRKKLAPAIGFEAKLMMPDGTTPDLNDGHRYQVSRLMTLRARIAPENPMVRWLVRGDQTAAPKEKSLALAWSGFVVMRTGWTQDAVWALLDGGPFGRAHQHEDKLNVLFYANGKLLLTEGGNYAYDASPMRSYVLDTASHNTVRVDGKPQNRKVSYQWQEDMIRQKADMRWHFSTCWDYGEAAYSQGYGEEAALKATHTRRVFLRKERQPLLIVVDRMEADAPHRYECLWHVDSALQAQEEGLARFEEMDVAFSSGCAEHVIGQEEPEWQGFVATGTKQGMYRALSCLSVHIQAACTRIVTAFAPYRSGEDRLVGVRADGGIGTGELSLVWASGRQERLTEEAMMQEG